MADRLDRNRPATYRFDPKSRPVGSSDRINTTLIQFERQAAKALGTYLEKMWNPSTRMLDLSDMKMNRDITELVPNLNNLSFCVKLAQAIADGRGWASSLDSINFANNGIYTLQHLCTALLDKSIRVVNLCLTGNKLTELHEIDHLIRFNLREVMLSDNPIAKQGSEYHRYIVKHMRTIELLDTVSVKDWRKQILPKLPDPKDQCMADADNTRVIEQFCCMYFKYIDEAKFENLIDAYDNSAFFSHVVTKSVEHSNTGAKTYFSNLHYRNHNLMDMYNRKNPTRFLYKGRTAILDFLQKELYAKVTVKHDVTKFKVDAVTMGAAIFCTVHGVASYTFRDDACVYTRNFDRTFVLKPNKAGTEWPARIANETLMTRLLEDQPILASEDGPQLATDVAAQLVAATGLTDAFVNLLLKESGGNYDAALALFNTNKAQGAIPRDAFKNP